MWKKISRVVISLFLVALTLFQGTGLSAAAVERQTRYISDIAVGSKEELEAQGYTVVQNDLNEGGTASYIGYMFTDDASKGIVDVAALEMNSGYSPLNYYDNALNNNAAVAALADKFQTAISAFVSSYNAGNPYAEIAYETLNALTYTTEVWDETTGTYLSYPLGDYFVGGYYTTRDCKKLLVITKNDVLSLIYNQLTIAAADDLTKENSTSWLTRLCSNGPFVFQNADGTAMEEGAIEDLYQQYDTSYGQRASEIYEKITDFVEEYQAAVERNGSAANAAAAAPSDDEAQDEYNDLCTSYVDGDTIAFDDAAQTATAAQDAEIADSSDAVVVAYYAVLDAKKEDGSPVYAFGTKDDGTAQTLAEFFVKVAGMTDLNAAYRELYPLIAVRDSSKQSVPMTEAQQIMFTLNGLMPTVSAAAADASSIDSLKADAEEKIAALKSHNNGEAVNVWYNVNEDMTDPEGVCWTSTLTRQTAASENYGILTQPEGDGGMADRAELKTAMIALSMTTVAALGLGMLTACVTMWVIGIKVSVLGICSYMVTAAAECLSGALISVATCLITVTVAIGVLALVAAIGVAIAWLIKKFSADKDDEELVLTDIPNIVYDYGEDENKNECAVRYQVVKYVGSDEAANLNAGNDNTPWLALYYSTNTNLGDPITVEVENDQLANNPFVVSADVNTPSGYSPVHAFDETTAVNLNSGRTNVTGIYAFMCKTASSGADDSGETGEDDETVTAAADGTYIRDVIMCSENSEEAAKDAIRKRDGGYNLIDYNLTSDSEYATYIGYTTTTESDKAITDLRVAYSTGLDANSASVKYGAASYGCCGKVGNLMLFETRSATAGTPILVEGFTVTNKLNSVPEGYEPVNLFCGGPAFNFNACDGWEIRLNDDEDGYTGGREDCPYYYTSAGGNKIHYGSSAAKNYWTKYAVHGFAYIYFQPSVMYKASDEGAIQYLGGLAFLNYYENNAAHTISGWQILNNANIGNGLTDDGITYDLSCAETGEAGGAVFRSYNMDVYLSAWGLKSSSGYVCLCYTTTCNPYRAIYDIQYAEGGADTQSMPAFLTLGTGSAAVVDTFAMAPYYPSDKIYDTSEPSVSEVLRFSHSYRSTYEYEGGVFDSDNYVEVHDSDDGYGVFTRLRCATLYVVGNTASNISAANPIKLSELAVTNTPEHDASQYTPIRSITDCYSENGANLAFSYDPVSLGGATDYTYAETDENGNRQNSMYLYLHRSDANATRPKYIASVTVDYEEGRDYDGDDNTGYDTPCDQAVFSLVGKGQGTLLEVNLTGQGTWTLSDGSYLYDEEGLVPDDTDYAVALVWVTYTDAPTSAITDLCLYESEEATAPSSVTTKDGATAYPCGKGFRTSTSSPYYYLMYIKNTGNPITELVFDSKPMTQGCWTTLNSDNTIPDYQTYFIKSKHALTATRAYYITGIYYGTGATEADAQISLLEQGCRYCCDFNLSPDGAANPIYLGYNISYSYSKAYTGLVLEDCGQNSTVTAVNFGAGHYEKITDTLNSGVYDSLIYLFGTREATVAKGSSKLSNAKYWRYISDITFYTDTDLNDYATGDKDLDEIEDESMRAYVAGLITDMEDNPIEWDLVTNSDYDLINCNVTALSGGVLDTDATTVYMYVHYSDNSTRNLDYLYGSVFTKHPLVIVIVSCSGVLILLAAVYCILKKRKRVKAAVAADAEPAGDASGAQEAVPEVTAGAESTAEENAETASASGPPTE